MLYSLGRSFLRIFYKLVFRIETVGTEHIPDTGPVILCSNHKSNWDPPTVATFLQRRVRFMAKSELFDIPLFGWLIVRLGAFPVRRGGISKESVRTTLDILNQGQVLLIFPEGSRRNKSGIGKKGAANFAVKSRAAVIPAAIIGDYKPFRPMKVIYGEPLYFDSQEDPGSDDLEKMTETIMSRIYSLEKEAAASPSNH